MFPTTIIFSLLTKCIHKPDEMSSRAGLETSDLQHTGINQNIFEIPMNGYTQILL